MVKDWGNRLICRIDVTGFLSIQVALLAAFFAYYMFYPDLSMVAELPKAHHSVAMRRADWEDALTVTVLRDGKIYLGTERVSVPEDLWYMLRDSIRGGSEKRVYIKADRYAKFKAVSQVLDMVRSAGIQKVSFLTDQPRD